ncbi:MAG: hypothetical protein KDC67_03900 [Ignavibacteriae bacterium]|nr:hypothetical protein [Ignavibacteriota bacterium]
MKKEYIILALGLVFSIFQLSLGKGLEFEGIKFNSSIIDVAFNSSNENNIKTALIGYFFFLVFSFNHVILKKNLNFIAIIFLLLNMFAIIFELISIKELNQGKFNGKHFSIGIVFFIVGLYLLSLKKRKKIN